MIIALPIPQIKTTNNNYARGDQFVESLIQGEKIPGKPNYLLFTAPYKLCEDGCSGQEENFDMAFPLYVGEKGKEQYKNQYPRDFKEIYITKPYAPFKKRSSINPLTFCPTETTTAETTATVPQTETLAPTVEQSTVPKTSFFATIAKSTVYETDTPKTTTQLTAVFETETPTQTTEVMPMPTESTTDFERETPTQTIKTTTVFETEDSTSIAEEVLMSTFESTTDFITETNTETPTQTTEEIPTPTESSTDFEGETPTPTIKTTTVFETEASTSITEQVLMSTFDSTTDFVTETNTETPTQTTEEIPTPTESTTDFKRETPIPTIKTTAVFETETSTSITEETSMSTLESTTDFITETDTPAKEKMPTRTTEPTTDFETLTAITETATVFATKTSTPTTEQTTDFKTETSTPIMETIKVFVTKKPWPTTGPTTDFETETLAETTDITTTFVTKRLTTTTEPAAYFETETSVIPTERIESTKVFLTPSTVFESETNALTTEQSPNLETDALTPSTKQKTNFEKTNVIPATVSNTIPFIETPILITKPNFETKHSVPATVLHTKPKTYHQPVVIIIISKSTTQMSPESITNFQTTSSHATSAMTVPETVSEKEIPEDDKANSDTVISETDYDVLSYDSVEILSTTTLNTHITKSPEINRSTYPDNKQITFVFEFTDNDYWNYDSSEKLPTTILKTYLTDADVTLTPRNNGSKFSENEQEEDTVIPKFDTHIFPDKSYDKEIEEIIPGIDYETDYEKAKNTDFETVTPEKNRSTYPDKGKNKIITFSETNNDYWNFDYLEKLQTTTLKTYFTDADVTLTPRNNGSKYPENEQKEDTEIPEFDTNIFPEKSYDKDIEEIIPGIDYETDYEKANNTVIETVTSAINRSTYPDKGFNKPITFSETDNDYWSYDSLEKNSTTTLKSYFTDIDVSIKPSNNGSNDPEKMKEENTVIPKIDTQIYPDKPYYEEIEVVVPGIDVETHNEQAHDKFFTTDTSKMYKSTFPDKSSHNTIIFSEIDNDYWSDGSLDFFLTTLETYVTKPDNVTVILEINGSGYPEKDNGKEGKDPEQPFYNEEIEEIVTILERLDNGSKTVIDGIFYSEEENKESDKLIPEINGSIYPEKGNGESIISETEYESLERVPKNSLEFYVTNIDGLICPKPIRGVCKMKTKKVMTKLVNLDVMYSDSEINNYL